MWRPGTLRIFPSNTARSRSERCSNVHADEVCVLLLGWLGCSAKHLAKYCEMWRRLSDRVHVLALRPGIAQVAFPVMSDRVTNAVVERLFSPPFCSSSFTPLDSSWQHLSGNNNYRHEALSTKQGGFENMEQDNTMQGKHSTNGSCGGYEKSAYESGTDSLGASKVLVHCMSNAGFMAFGNILRRSKEAEEGGLHERNGGVLEQLLVKSRVAGIVLDSAPSEATAEIWAKGTVSSLLKKPVARTKKDHKLLLSLGEGLAKSYFSVPKYCTRLDALYAAWRTGTPLVPQLYLYSSGDSLIPSQQIEEFRNQQQERGITTISHRWEDSEHCEHYRKHPVEYTAAIRDFLDKIPGKPDLFS